MSTDPNQDNSHWDSPFSERVAGMFLLVSGSALSYLFILSPLLDAMRGAASVSSSMKVVAITPNLLGFGLILTVFGKRGSRLLFNNSKQLSLLAFLLTLVLVIVGIGVSFWLCTTLEGYGYR